MGFFIGATVGMILGALITCFVIGASRVNYESEVYMEGYLAGQVEAMKGEDVSFTDDLLNTGYNKGLNDAWELAKEVWAMSLRERDDAFGYEKFIDVLEDYTPQEAFAKLEEYEDSKIEVGDVVKLLRTMQVCIITRIQDKSVRVLFKDGTGGMIDVPIDEIEKTGKHINIQQILDSIGE